VGQKGDSRVTLHAPGSAKNVREWTLTFQNELLCWELEFQMDSPESLECDCRGQNPLPWRILYIIGKLLKLRFLKWAHISHLHIWNTSYGQKKGRESNCQFDSWPLKVGNRPDFLACRQHATYCWKALNEGYNIALDLIANKGVHAKLCAPKVAGVPIGGISGLLSKLPMARPNIKSVPTMH
jgi:hypothetical protein